MEIKLDKQDLASLSLAKATQLMEILHSAASAQAETENTVAEKPQADATAAKAEKPKATRAKKETPVKAEAPAEEPAEEPAPEEAPAEKSKAQVIDLEAMKKRVMAIKDKDADKWDSIKGLIKKYGNGKLSAIPEDDREEFMEAVEAL